jgi:hypothetical protein
MVVFAKRHLHRVAIVKCSRPNQHAAFTSETSMYVSTYLTRKTRNSSKPETRVSIPMPHSCGLQHAMLLNSINRQYGVITVNLAKILELRIN